MRYIYTFISPILFSHNNARIPNVIDFESLYQADLWPGAAYLFKPLESGLRIRAFFVKQIVNKGCRMYIYIYIYIMTWVLEADTWQQGEVFVFSS